MIDAEYLFPSSRSPLAPPDSVDAFHAAIFAGHILHLRRWPEFAAIVAWTQGLLREKLGDIAAVDLHRHVPASELDGFLAPLQQAYSGSGELARLWHRFFDAAGFDPEMLTCDRFLLRFQPPLTAVDAQPWRLSTATIGVHRDTWATNLYSQVNWWGPVFPITDQRTVGFYPDYWDQPISNDSAGFAIRDGMIKLGKDRDSVQPEDLSPAPTRFPSRVDCLPVVIDPGDVIAFSGQHLHAGVANVTGQTRISVEARTIRIGDHLGGSGAPNTDGASAWTSPGMFRRISDGRRLSELASTDPIGPFNNTQRD